MGFAPIEAIAPAISSRKDILPRKEVFGKYKIIRKLGVGLQGEVVLAKQSGTEDLVAIKVCRDSLRQEALLEESKAMKLLKHKHVLSVKEVVNYNEKLGLVMEYTKHGDLFDIVSTTGHLSEGVAREYFIQLIDALEECHKANIYHRDVKLENILLDDQFSIKLCDFGMAATAKADHLLTDICGTASYLAPEVATRSAYRGAPVDIWCLGVMLFIMLCGFPPFQIASSKDKWYRMLLRESPEQFWALHEKHAQFSSEVKNLITKMLTPHASQRATIAEIRKDTWVNKSRISKEALIDDMQHRYTKIVGS